MVKRKKHKEWNGSFDRAIPHAKNGYCVLCSLSLAGLYGRGYGYSSGGGKQAGSSGLHVF